MSMKRLYRRAVRILGETCIAAICILIPFSALCCLVELFGRLMDQVLWP